MQVGNLTANQKIEKKEIENLVSTGKNQLERPPNWLISEVAKKEYRRIVKEIKDIEVIGNLDRNNLGGYCNAYAFYLQASELLKTQDLIIKKTLPNGSKVDAENPLIKIQKTYAEEMRKFAALCGLTIDSRLKMAVVKMSKEDEKITNEFGDI